MFGSKKNDTTTLDTALEQVGTIIGPGSVLEGPLTTKESTRIDGTIKGNVTVSGALIVGQSARIVGTVSCMNAYIAGEVEGNISAPQGKVEISDSGKVIGDISCKGIIIDENAVFHGSCAMTGVDKSSAAIAKERAVADKAAEGSPATDSDKTENEADNSGDNKSENQENTTGENNTKNSENTSGENKSDDSEKTSEENKA